MADDKKPSPPPPPPSGKPDPKAEKPKKEKGKAGNLLKSLDQSKLKTNAKLIGGLIAVVISISGLLWFVLLQFTQSSTPEPPPPKKPPVVSEQQRRAQEQARQRQIQAQQRQAQAKAEAQRRAQRLQQQQQQLQQQQRQSTLSTRSGVPAQQTSYYNQQQQQKHLRPDEDLSVDELPFTRPPIKQVRAINNTWGDVSDALLAVENQREMTIKQISLK